MFGLKALILKQVSNEGSIDITELVNIIKRMKAGVSRSDIKTDVLMLINSGRLKLLENWEVSM